MVIIIHCERRNLDYGIPGRTGIQSIPLRDEVSAPKGVCEIGRNKSSRLIEWASAWIFVGWLVCVFPDKEMELSLPGRERRRRRQRISSISMDESRRQCWRH